MNFHNNIVLLRKSIFQTPGSYQIWRKDSWAFRTHWCCIHGNKEVFKSYYLHGGVLGEWSMAMGKLQSSYSKRPYISSAEITIMCTAWITALIGTRMQSKGITTTVRNWCNSTVPISSDFWPTFRVRETQRTIRYAWEITASDGKFLP